MDYPAIMMPSAISHHPYQSQHQSSFINQNKRQPLSFSAKPSASFGMTPQVKHPVKQFLLALPLLLLPFFSNAQNPIDKIAPEKQAKYLYDKVLNNPCGCGDEDGQAPPTIRFTEEHLRRAIELDPTINETLPTELQFPEPGDDFLFNPEDLRIDELIKRGLLNEGYEVTPLEGGAFYKITSKEEDKIQA